MATKKLSTLASIESTSLSNARPSARKNVRAVEKSLPTEFDPAQAMRAGIGAGAVMGVIIGGTFWTHSPDTLHLQIALAVIIFCMVMGGVFGRLVASIKPE
jgi:hypothetical protein